MRLPKFGRKKPRSYAALFREPPAPVKSASPWRGIEWLWLGAALVVCVAAVTKPPDFSRKVVGYDIESQSVALDEVRADIYFETEDLRATKEARDEAAAKIPDTYRVDRDRVEEQLRRLDDRIMALLAQQDQVGQAVRQALKTSASDQQESDVVAKAIADYAATLQQDPAWQNAGSAASLALWLMPAPECLPHREFATPSRNTNRGTAGAPAVSLVEPEAASFKFAYAGELAKLAKDGLEYVLTYGVRPLGKAENATKTTITVVRETPVGDLKVSEDLPWTKVPTATEAATMLNDRIRATARTMAAKPSEQPIDWARAQDAAFEMAKSGIADTLSFDEVFTEGARERARLAVPAVMKEVQPGEVIQRSGDRWSAQSRSDVRTYWTKLREHQEPRSRALAMAVAHALLVAMCFLSLARAVTFLTRDHEFIRRNMNLSLLLLAATLVLGRVVSYFEPSGFVMPTAAVAILVAILVNPRIAVMTGMLAAMLVSVQFGYDWRILVVGGAMSLAGAFSTYVVRRRSDMTNASLKATVAGVLVMIAISLAMESPVGEAAIRRCCLVLLSGGACLLLVPGVLSPLERLFGITTDIQLLEYSDLNNELLSRLAIETPATYAHSLMLGQIAEAAAEAIGANGLLARVCAYYHDIGKLHRPDYFSENQTGFNVHDELPPRMSARAIATHVSDGVQIAHEFHLPKPIVDGIVEHHGTCLISFFYQQAVEQHKHRDVNEQDFRYPGPKPQSRETAILMICDAVESGVRSIKNPNEERIREFVDKIIVSRSNDRQFDECELTLKDLDTIKDVVARRVITALHARIAYPPEKKPEKRADNVITLSGGSK